MGWFPCECCGTCGIFEDGFNRADSTDIGSDWTETTGNWEVSSNKLIPDTTTSDQVCLCDTTHTAGEGYVSVDVSSTSFPDETVLYLAYASPTNNLAAVLSQSDPSINAWILKLYDGGSLVGSSTQDYPTGSPESLTLWLKDGRAVAEVNTSVVQWYDVSATGTKAGVGIKGAPDGTHDLSFDNFVLKEYSGADDDCEIAPSEPCDFGCDTDLWPTELSVTISGSCSGVSGTYTLQAHHRVEFSASVAWTTCIWHYFSTTNLIAAYVTGSTLSVYVDNYPDTALYTKTLSGSTPDCTAFSSESCTYSSSSGGKCTWSSLTATVSAI